MKASITPVPSFILRVGDTGLGSFHVDGTWHGLTRLVSNNDAAQTAIIARDDGLSTAIARAFNDKAPEAVTIVMCSPALLSALDPEDIKP